MGIANNVRRLFDSDGFADLAKLVGRLLLGLPFPIFGTLKIHNFDRMSAYVEAGGLPREAIYLAIAVQILGGVAVWLGFKTRWAAFLLGGFCIVAPLIYHNNFADLGELSAFTKDFAAAGGFLLLWLVGPGRYSLDHWLATRGAAG